jgi:cyclophilin family peptidyl-prolyl cis-trans isomerase
MGQHPTQQMLPKQTGVKALYCRQQIVLQHFEQQPHGLKNHAEAGTVSMARAARLNKPTASSFFMVCAFFVKAEANCPRPPS